MNFEPALDFRFRSRLNDNQNLHFKNSAPCALFKLLKHPIVRGSRSPSWLDAVVLSLATLIAVEKSCRRPGAARDGTVAGPMARLTAAVASAVEIVAAGIDLMQTHLK